MLRVWGILIDLVADLLRWLLLACRSSQSIQAENLFLRRQLALYIERGVRPRRIDAATRISLTFLSRVFHWRDALTVVRPATMIRWHQARLATILENEVSGRPAAHSPCVASTDSSDGQ